MIPASHSNSKLSLTCYLIVWPVSISSSCSHAVPTLHVHIFHMTHSSLQYRVSYYLYSDFILIILLFILQIFPHTNPHLILVQLMM
jgi:hypothetical protein